MWWTLLPPISSETHLALSSLASSLWGLAAILLIVALFGSDSTAAPSRSATPKKTPPGVRGLNRFIPEMISEEEPTDFSDPYPDHWVRASGAKSGS